MERCAIDLDLATPEDTAALGVAIGARLGVGDVLLLEGEIGAGKTHFARSLIQSLMDIPEDVPSPTFTLVQVYDSRIGEIWHSDLYRLSAPDEADELGLSDAFTSAICLVEWPDRLGDEVPQSALMLRFTDTGQGRHVTLRWRDRAWAARLEGLSS